MIENRKARHLYEILETFDAGISLLGWEVKSIRKGSADISQAYAVIRGEEAYLLNMHISPYQSQAGIDPVRTRKLLLTKKEIRYLMGKLKEKGVSLISLKVYFKKGLVKVSLGLVKGKKKWDRRQEIKKREMAREARKH